MEREGHMAEESKEMISEAVREGIKQGIPLAVEALTTKRRAEPQETGEESDDDGVPRDARRFGLPAVPERGYKYEWIHSEQLGEKPVKWAETREQAETDIKDLLGRIEIAKSSITTQMKVDIENAKAVLEVLEVRKDRGLVQEQIKAQQDWAKKMRLEIRTRIDFHNVFFTYENGSSVKELAEAIGKIPSVWMDVIFELKEKIPGTEEQFNPFIEALQYYEDHGHEFARHNVAKGREKFGKKAQGYLINYVDKKRLGLVKKETINGIEYEVPKSDEELTPENWDLYNKYVAEQLQEQAKIRFSIDINKQIGINPTKIRDEFTDEEKQKYKEFEDCGKLSEFIKPKLDDAVFSQAIKKFGEEIKKELGIDPKKREEGFTAEEKQKYEEYKKSGKLGEFIKQKLDQTDPQSGRNFKETLNREIYLSNKLDEKKYAWAQNMAERLFRSTGRAIMYDYLVVNKDGRDGYGNVAEERAVGIHYKPSKNESVEWAGGRDGCDYPMSKILRFRENLATSSESNLMRPHLELMDGVDIFGGDFWRTVRDSNVKKSAGDGSIWTHRLAREDVEKRVVKKTEELIKDDNETREEAERKARELFSSKKYYLIDKPDTKSIADKQEIQRILDAYEADKYTDREDADNEGEMVGRIDFRQMERKKTKNGELEGGVEFRGIEFEENSGDSPWGIWTVRRLGGSEEAKKALTENSSCFLLNPNFESLAKLISTFDATKDNAWKVKKALLRNFIKYARSEKIEGTGKRRYTEDEILAGVNKLTGLTDQNGVQFVQLPERMKIIAEYFNIKISPEDEKKIKEQARRQARGELDKLDDEVSKGIKTREAANKEIEGLANQIEGKMINDKLNGKIEGRVNRKFAASFAGNFALGAIQGALKQVLAELGIK